MMQFMQDYRVHLKHQDGTFEKIPYFCLPANELTDVIAPSCYSCFDYPNAGADLVVGYMGTPYNSSTPMTQHLQYLTVRNERGRAMLNAVQQQSNNNNNNTMEILPPISKGSRGPFVMQTVLADDEAKMGNAPTGAPRWIGEILATILTKIGPSGLEFARYSLDYHVIRNYIHVVRHWGVERAERHIPEYAKRIVKKYDERNGGVIAKRAAMPAAFPGTKK